MLYTVKYRKPWWPFWRKIRRVKGDATYDKNARQFLPYRVLILDDETRLEMPHGLILKFHPDRFRSIHKSVDVDARQSVPVNSGLS